MNDDLIYYSLWLTPNRQSTISKKIQSIASKLCTNAHNPTFPTHITLNTFHCTTTQLQQYQLQLNELFNNQLNYIIDVKCKSLASTPDKMFMTVFVLVEHNPQLLNVKYQIESIINQSGNIEQSVQQYIPHISLLYDTDNVINPAQREQYINDTGSDILSGSILSCDTIELMQCNGTDYTKWDKICDYKLSTPQQ